MERCILCGVGVHPDSHRAVSEDYRFGYGLACDDCSASRCAGCPAHPAKVTNTTS